MMKGDHMGGQGNGGRPCGRSRKWRETLWEVKEMKGDLVGGQGDDEGRPCGRSRR